MKLVSLLPAVSAILLLQLFPVSAWAAGEHDKHHASAPAAGQTTGDAASNVDGEVRKIDKDARKITLKHGEIKNLEMPAMTMVFQVKDASFLDKVKTGDRVKFKAEKVSGGFAVTEIELAK